MTNRIRITAPFRNEEKKKKKSDSKWFLIVFFFTENQISLFLLMLQKTTIFLAHSDKRRKIFTDHKRLISLNESAICGFASNI